MTPKWSIMSIIRTLSLNIFDHNHKQIYSQIANHTVFLLQNEIFWCQKTARRLAVRNVALNANRSILMTKSIMNHQKDPFCSIPWWIRDILTDNSSTTKSTPTSTTFHRKNQFLKCSPYASLLLQPQWTNYFQFLWQKRRKDSQYSRIWVRNIRRAQGQLLWTLSTKNTWYTAKENHLCQ